MINPITDAMQEFPIDSSKNDEAEGITVGPDGNLWFTLTRADKIACDEHVWRYAPRILGHRPRVPGRIRSHWVRMAISGSPSRGYRGHILSQRSPSRAM